VETGRYWDDGGFRVEAWIAPGDRQESLLKLASPVQRSKCSLVGSLRDRHRADCASLSRELGVPASPSTAMRPRWGGEARSGGSADDDRAGSWRDGARSSLRGFYERATFSDQDPSALSASEAPLEPSAIVNAFALFKAPQTSCQRFGPELGSLSQRRFTRRAAHGCGGKPHQLGPTVHKGTPLS
jgi:hypothetical protein